MSIDEIIKNESFLLKEFYSLLMQCYQHFSFVVSI